MIILIMISIMIMIIRIMIIAMLYLVGSRDVGSACDRDCWLWNRQDQDPRARPDHHFEL